MIGRAIGRRLAIGVPVVIGTTAVNFILLNAAPGSPLNSLVDPMAGPEVREAMERDLGLDQPLAVQYFHWLGHALRGDLGYSYSTYRPVAEVIGERIFATTVLVGSAFVVAYLIGILLGTLAALRPYSKFDVGSSVVGVLGISTPSFIFGLVLIYVFALELDLFPVGNMTGLDAGTNFGDLAAHLVLPVIALAVFDAAVVMRYTRASMLEVMNEDYVRTAVGKGLRGRRVVGRHALPNALSPVITLAGMSLPSLFGGAVVVEVVFQWPGMGQLAVNSVLARDYPTLLGLSLIFSVLVIVGNLIADVLYAIANPRVNVS